MKKKFFIILIISLSILFCPSQQIESNKSVILIGKLAKLECNTSDSSEYVSTKGTGTITFYDISTNSFAAVGHGIKSDNKLLEIENGNIYFSEISNIKKSTKNSIGNLSSKEISNNNFGNITKNNDFGIYGKCNKKLIGKRIEISPKNDIEHGNAILYLDLGNNTKKEFNIEIIEICNYSNNSNACFKIKITDSDLLNITGGIVKGMSGSPIIQNGKLIGALTKVTSDNVTEGYGIFIETMLNECK